MLLSNPAKLSARAGGMAEAEGMDCLPSACHHSKFDVGLDSTDITEGRLTAIAELLSSPIDLSAPTCRGKFSSLLLLMHLAR